MLLRDASTKAKTAFGKKPRLVKGNVFFAICRLCDPKILLSAQEYGRTNMFSLRPVTE